MSQSEAKSPADVSITPEEPEATPTPEPTGRRIKGFRTTPDIAPNFAIYMQSIGATLIEVLFVVEKEDFPVLADGEPVKFTIVGTREQVEAVRAEALAQGDTEIVEGAIVVEDEPPVPDGPDPGEHLLPEPNALDDQAPVDAPGLDAFIDAHLAEVP